MQAQNFSTKVCKTEKNFSTKVYKTAAQRIFFVEGYGCSLNRSDTEKIRGMLQGAGFPLAAKPEEASCIIINTCAVKQPTETRMLKRITQLNKVASSNGGKLIVSGCLPEINPAAISGISRDIIQIGPALEELCSYLHLPKQKFQPLAPEIRGNNFISIIPIARGCLGECSYCCVRQARDKLKSYPLARLDEKFGQAIKETKEIWLTAQDTGCYGKDKNSSLPALLERLLQNKGEFRIRVGMLNPQHLLEFYPAYIPLFSDERLYRFFHLPLQSGSNKILRAMKRPYSAGDFLLLAKKIRKQLPDAAISTDIIAGFPGETEEDFRQTLALLEKAKPDIVNISRYGDRPNTAASKMQGKLHGRVSKQRSRAAAKLCGELALCNNKKFVGKKQKILVTEEGQKGGFVGRNGSYKPVVIGKDLRGQFAEVEIAKAFPTYLAGKLLPK